MKKLLVMIPFLFLVGCKDVGGDVARHFPEVPEDLKVACPALDQVTDTTKLSDVVKSVSDNYAHYHECRVKVDAWIEWYKTQRAIFESVK